jgi:hypothetical protein
MGGCVLSIQYRVFKWKDKASDMFRAYSVLPNNNRMIVILVDRDTLLSDVSPLLDSFREGLIHSMFMCKDLPGYFSLQPLGARSVKECEYEAIVAEVKGIPNGEDSLGVLDPGGECTSDSL